MLVTENSAFGPPFSCYLVSYREMALVATKTQHSIGLNFVYLVLGLFVGVSLGIFAWMIDGIVLLA